MSMQAVSYLVLVGGTPLEAWLIGPDHIIVLSHCLRTVLKCKGSLSLIYFQI